MRNRIPSECNAYSIRRVQIAPNGSVFICLTCVANVNAVIELENQNAMLMPHGRLMLVERVFRMCIYGNFWTTKNAAHIAIRTSCLTVRCTICTRLHRRARTCNLIVLQRSNSTLLFMHRARDKSSNSNFNSIDIVILRRCTPGTIESVSVQSG